MSFADSKLNAHKRFFVLLLILCQLGFSSAWAFDWHGPHADDQVHGVASSDAGVHFDGDGCDDSCHALAHLLGITSDKAGLHFASASVPAGAYRSAFTSRVTDPPLKPPQS